jgi:hypothetical protein
VQRPEALGTRLFFLADAGDEKDPRSMGQDFGQMLPTWLTLAI